MDRAAELVDRNPWAAEVLRFYERILHLQQSINAGIASAGSSSVARGSLRDALDYSHIAQRFPEVCGVVEQHGTAAMRESIPTIRSRSSRQLEHLLRAIAADGASDTDLTPIERMLSLALLQPYAERIASERGVSTVESGRGLCPSCDRRPVAGVLRPEGDGGKRWLVCSFCLSEWEFRRILCPYCGEQEHGRLPVFSSSDESPVRIHACHTCRRYLKVVDMTVDGHAVVIVDEVAAAPLDVWAAEQGYQKIERNLLGY